MDLVQAMVLGLIQGITEFLPVSSSGHLVLAHRWLGVQEGSLAFDVWLHVGTLAAVLTAYRKDVRAFLAHPTSRIWKLIVVGTVPTALLGFLLHDAVAALFEDGASLPWEFAVTGIVLYLAESVPRGRKRIKDLRTSDAWWVGLCQGLAVLPALSRSGMTLAGALWRGMDRTEAARFSFLLSVPAIAGAALQEWLGSLGEGRAPGWAEGVGAFSAAVSGYLAISWMLRILATKSLKPFAWYVWALGAGVCILQWAHRF
ncbi:MAG: undecaprenyl-diphosphate phosphatase [Kyrpidia sp.]|nr:undecaprenyl-diphosphate phosphatase [Kyrpidia sp.]